MSEPVIRAEHLSKQYRIGAREGYRTFRETLVDAAKAPLQGLSKAFNRRSVGGGRSYGDDTIWALKDVSFEVKQGEVVGIIGRNGAGKSTLLKILSRITDPTEGRVELRGRVGSLLEVGTGFHPELTGHENIYLYGAILGMDRWEITRKFDEIVAFAEIEKFIDTPVKKYSSGMYMRLAFAVAAHLEPEILLVDEVLAVGDAAFQKKCLGKMGEVSKTGRTVLFVSHNMGAINALCERALLLLDGTLALDDVSAKVVKTYLASIIEQEGGPSAEKALDAVSRKGRGTVRIMAISIRNEAGNLSTSFSIWEPFIVDFTLRAQDHPVTISPWILIYSSDGRIVLGSFQYDTAEPFKLKSEEARIRLHVDSNILTPGAYVISPGVFGRNNEFYDWIDNAISFEIRREFASGKTFDGRLGETTVRYRWEIM